MSSPILAGRMRASEAVIPRRASHQRSARTGSTLSIPPPADLSSLSSAAVSSRTSASSPSNSTSSNPPASRGNPQGRDRSSDSTVMSSRNSSLAGTIPRSMICATTRSADSPSGKLAARTLRCGGSGRNCSVISVTMPSVPSEPMTRSITASSSPRLRLTRP